MFEPSGEPDLAVWELFFLGETGKGFEGEGEETEALTEGEIGLDPMAEIKAFFRFGAGVEADAGLGPAVGLGINFESVLFVGLLEEAGAGSEGGLVFGVDPGAEPVGGLPVHGPDILFGQAAEGGGGVVVEITRPGFDSEFGGVGEGGLVADLLAEADFGLSGGVVGGAGFEPETDLGLVLLQFEPGSGGGVGFGAADFGGQLFRGGRERIASGGEEAEQKKERGDSFGHRPTLAEKRTMPNGLRSAAPGLG